MPRLSLRTIRRSAQPAAAEFRSPWPSVTVVIPVWDEHVAFLARCVRAIACQDVPVSLVVVDNASEKPIQAPEHARVVRLLHRQSIGAARNEGLQRVTTPYVVFADADDEVASGALAGSLALLRQHPRAPGVIGRSLLHHGSHTERGKRPTSIYRVVDSIAPKLTSVLWLVDFQGSITSTVLRTSAVRDAGGFADNDTAEDWYLAARLARRGAFVCIDDLVRIYHRHSAALRLRRDRNPAPQLVRRAICDDCLSDPRATPVQRAVAASVRHRS
jgi:cellulose synthase/poly-beta-1,6-N-acetylglucosamine synthase-like glycosyltransferase